MKEEKLQITAYEVRDDEKAFFLQLAGELNVEVIYTTETLNKNTLHLSTGSKGITTLGQSHINSSMLHKLMAMNIKCVATRTIGHNHIDLKAAEELGIKVCNAHYEPNGVADYTIMLILMSLRKYKQAMFRANVNDYSLTGLRGREMKDLTIGIVGTGNIGAKVIDNLSGFGCKVLAFDNFQKECIKEKAEYVTLNELYKKSDVISYHVPLLESTRQMVNRKTIEEMKDGVVLINCARGELMNIPDIIAGIESEKLGALALDVFENEAGIYHLDRRTEIISNKDMAYIRQFPNVIMTQHIAFYTDAAVKSMVTCAMSSIVSVLTSGKSVNEVN